MGPGQVGGEAGDLGLILESPHLDWQVMEEGCGLLCNPCSNCGHCDNCCDPVDEEGIEEEEGE